MDQVDKKIVRELQLNAKISMKELAEVVHLSSPAVTERVRKLEEADKLLKVIMHMSH